MEILISVSVEIASFIMASIRRRVSYLIFYKDIFEKLEHGVRMLEEVKHNIMLSVEGARRNGREIDVAVRKWLIQVDDIIREAEQLLDDPRHRKARCSNWSFPNLFSRHELSRKAMKIAEYAAELQETGYFDQIGYLPPLDRLGFFTSNTIEKLESRNSMKEKIMQALIDPEISIIGVYGLGGVGKTILVTQVARQVNEEKLFDAIVMARVSASPNVERIQGEIADHLGLQFGEVTIMGRARRLYERIKTQRHILIILDDIWERFDLVNVGIPSKFDHEGCKLLLTSRNQNILEEMGTQKDFRLDVLNEEESWSLFEDLAGDVKDASLHSIATQVAKRCDGLPLLIATVARSLKNKDILLWKEVLNELQVVDNKGINEIVYSSLELSYHYLKGDEIKELFLLSGVLYLSPLNVEYLLICVMGLGIFKRTSTFEGARLRLHRLIDSLKAAGLLLETNTNEEVKMLDIVTRVALSIASRDHQVLKLGLGVELKKWPTEYFLQRCSYIILDRCDIHKLPERLECPNVKFFHLYDRNHSLGMPDSFFEGMRNLKVLNLSCMHLSTLPKSFYSLTDLQTLCLYYCALGDLTNIGALENLQILSLCGSSMIRLPYELGQLTLLKKLDLTSSRIEIIPSNIIPELTNLEELCMGNTSIKWELGKLVQENRNATLAELRHLKNLTALEIKIQEAWIWPGDLVFDKLERYKIVIGEWEWSHNYAVSKMLKLKLGNTRLHLEHGIKELVKRVEDLYLDEINGTSNMLYDLSGEGFPLLKHLQIQNDAEIHHIINSVGRNQNIVLFPNLETLILQNLYNLKRLCYGPLMVNFFGKLRVLKVKSCDKLEYLLSVSTVEALSLLLEIEVSECSSMKKIVFVESMDSGITNIEDKIEFRSLRSLTLQRLPTVDDFCSNELTSSITTEQNSLRTSTLTSFSNAEAAAIPRLEHLKLICIPRMRHLVKLPTTGWVVPVQNLETMEIVECHDLLYLFIIEDIDIDGNYGGLLPRLRQLCLRNLNRFRSIIGGNLPRRILNFKMLNQLTVYGCNQLKYLPLCDFKNLKQLQNIDISDCATLKHVFAYEEDRVTTMSNEVELPLLRSLKLSNLPMLASIFSGAHHIISLYLKQMTIEDCPNLAFTYAPSWIHIREEDPSVENSEEMITVPSVEKLDLRQLDHFRKMCKDRLVSFEHLTSLQLYKCTYLEYLFPLSVAQGLSSLQELKIISCEGIEQIIIKEMGETESASSNTVEFPQLNTLILEKLPKFTRFCQDGSFVKWPSLKMVRVVECPMIQSKGLGKIDIPLLKLAEVKDNPWQDNDLESNNIIYLFELIDPLSALPDLTIEGSEQLKKYMEMELQEFSFTQLKMLKAIQCDEELNKFLSTLLPRSHRLEKLSVENCQQLEQVFDLGDFVAEKLKHCLFPNLDTIRLVDLPELNCIWNKDPSGIIELGKLVKLEVIKCGLPRGLFSTALVENLEQLKELNIDSCEMMKVVVGEERETKQERSFPKLKNLRLISLPELIKFNSGDCNFRFPDLESLWIENCRNMIAFTTGFLSMQTPTNEGTSDHMLNEIEDVSPKLQELKLVGLDTFEEIWGGCVSTKSVCELKELEMDTLSNLKYIFPSRMLPKLEKLETLIVRNCISLKHVLENDSMMVLKNLKILRVKSCHTLEKLSLSSSCLKLRELEISDCVKLKDIFFDTEETTRSLPDLESIVLENLQNLSSFFLETFEFPSLKKVRIVDCPALKTFSRQVSHTADNFFSDMDSFEKLEELHLMNTCNSDLPSSSLCKLKIVPSNTLKRMQRLKKITVQTCDALQVLFDINEDSLSGVGAMGLLPELQVLELSDLSNMQLLWNQEPIIPMFKKLTSLEIVRCKSIERLFSISVAEHLAALKLLKLYGCENMKQVLQGGGGNSKVVFQNLECLILKHLPNLISFCEEEFDFEFPSLQMVRVENIPKMSTFVKKSLGTPKLNEVYITYITKCWAGDLNETITYLYENKGKLAQMAEVGKFDNVSTQLNSFRLPTVAAASSSKGKEKLIDEGDFS